MQADSSSSKNTDSASSVNTSKKAAQSTPSDQEFWDSFKEGPNFKPTIMVIEEGVISIIPIDNTVTINPNEKNPGHMKHVGNDENDLRFEWIN